MARMPKGEPRSVPDLAGDQYDAMMGQERLNRQRAEAAAGNPPLSPYSALPPFKRSLDLLDNPARPEPTVMIGGRRYKGMDNGRANVLVDDPLLSPAELAEQRRAVSRVLFMAGNPIGSAAYDLATVANTSPAARDGALAAGGVFDAAMTGAAPFGVRVHGGVSAPKRESDPSGFQRPSARNRGVNPEGQALGIDATVKRPMLGTGTRANQRIDPPGWLGHGRDSN